MSKEERIRYSLEKDNILDNFKKSELMWFMKILYKENKQLKERITYLENSNNRREETIINLRNEQQLDKYKEVIEEVRKLINFYETTEWGLRGYSILQKFRETVDKAKVGDK